MSPFTAIARFRTEVVAERRRLAGALLLLILSAAADAVGIFVLSDMVDGALNADNWWQVARLSLLWLGLTAAASTTDYFGALISVAAGERIVLRLRSRVFRHVQLLSPVTHRRRGLGDLVVRHSADVEAVEHLIASGILSLVVAVLNIAGLLAVAFAMNPIVAGVALAAAPALWWLSSLFSGHQQRVTRDEREANSEIADAIATALAGHETTVAYNQQHREAARLSRHGRRWARARIGETKVESGFGALLSFAEVVVTLVVTLTGVWQVREGNLTVGQLIALTGYLAMLYPKLQEVGELRLSIVSTTVSAERIVELLDEPPHLSDGASAVDFSPPGDSLELDHVSFSRGDRTILRDVCATLRPNAITALVGPSGAGKSTVAALLTKMERPDSGRLLLDGMDYALITGTAVRDHVTLLPQVPAIKAGTVAENIAYGRPEAPLGEIIDAARDSGAHEFILRLPDGYNTPLSSEGLELSGGQRQRICIARAILRDTAVLVLDEPSAALDDESVETIIGPLRRLASGRTTLLITHDPRLTLIADHVLALRDGRLCGRPQQSAQSDGSSSYTPSASSTMVPK